MNDSISREEQLKSGGFGCVEKLVPERVPAVRAGFLDDVTDQARQRHSCVIRQNPNHRESVLALLRDPNWRLHLIAAVAVLLSPDRAVLCPALWEALDSGSWAAPQLAVVLSICDQQFVRGAKQRILAGCPVAPVRFTSPLEQHVVAGPGASPVRSGKNLAALVYLVRTMPDETQWAEAVGQTPEVAQALQSDRDAGDKLAAYWAAALRERLAELGLSLLQPAF